MKKIFLKIAAVLLIMAGSFSCDKDDDIDMSKIDFSNIEDLYAQPLPVIQTAVQGKWKLMYAKGGIAANLIQYFNNDCMVEFTADKKYIRSNSTEIDTIKFKWSKEVSYYTSGDFMYVMTFQNSYIIPLVMEKIYNDTLIFHQYQVSDFERFYCVKSTNF